MEITIYNVVEEKAKEIINRNIIKCDWHKHNNGTYDIYIDNACLIANGNFITILCDRHHFTFDNIDFSEVSIT